MIKHIVGQAAVDMGAPGGEQPHAVKTLETSGRGPVYNFTYDALGQMTGRESGAGEFEQAFDALGRLTSVVRDGEAATYFAYDPDGNRVLEIRPDGRTTFYPFPDYELEATGWPRTQIVLQPVEVAPSETFTVTWAAYGALLSDCSFSGDWPATPTTSSGEQQAQETVAGSYDYALSCSNEFGTSVVTRTLTVSNEPAAGDPPPAAPIQMTASLERTTYGLGGSTVALHREGQLTPGGPYIEELYYMHGNHLGSMTLLTDEAGDVVEKARYYPFGGYRLEPTGGITDIGFTGHRQDNLGWENTGLIYMGARYYDPLLRRFVSADTIVPNATDTLAYNRFAYVYNNPVNMVDPTGRIACDHPNLPDEGPCNDDGTWAPGPGTSPGGGNKPGAPPIDPPVAPNAGVGSTLPQISIFDLAYFKGFDFALRYHQELRSAAFEAIRRVGEALAAVLNATFPGLNLSAAEAFALVYSGPVTFRWTGEIANFAGFAESATSILIHDTRETLGEVTNKVHFIIHELGHAFNLAIGGGPYDDTADFLMDGGLIAPVVGLLTRFLLSPFYGIKAVLMSLEKSSQTCSWPGHTRSGGITHLGRICLDSSTITCHDGSIVTMIQPGRWFEMKQPYTRRLLPLICALLLLVACRPTAENELTPRSPTAVAAIEMTILPQSPTPEPMATGTRVSPTPTASSMPPTATPRLQVTSTATALPTIYPTLTPEERSEGIQQLFETNGGCRLPCFWGITPGETDWETADQILRPVADKITRLGLPDPFTAEVRLGEASPDGRRVFYLLVENGVVEEIAGRTSMSPFFSPANLMQTYGQPAEVYLIAGGDYHDGTIPFVVTLFYPQHRLWLTYGTDAIREDNNWAGCFFDHSNPPPEGISLYVPDFSAAPYVSSWGNDDIRTIVDGAETGKRFVGFDNFQPLSKATDLDVDDFYETFRDPDTPLCLETPAEFWITLWNELGD